MSVAFCPLCPTADVRHGLRDRGGAEHQERAESDASHAGRETGSHPNVLSHTQNRTGNLLANR